MVRSFNTESDVVPALVVSTDDPKGMGRVQCQRLDQSEIPIDQLPWIFIHSAGHMPQVFANNGGSIGESPHALIPGAWLNLPKQTADNQTAISHGAIPTDGSQGQGQS